MPAVKTASLSGTTEPLQSEATVEASETVRAMHRMIEERMMTGLDFGVPVSAVDRAIETASRWAAYPALAIAATFIGAAIGTIRS